MRRKLARESVGGFMVDPLPRWRGGHVFVWVLEVLEIDPRPIGVFTGLNHGMDYDAGAVAELLSGFTVFTPC